VFPLKAEKSNEPRRKRRNVGSAEFSCPNCGFGHSVTLWEEIEEDDLGAGLVAADPVSCRCGAALLVADDLENVNVYWLNKREMQRRAFLKSKQKIRSINGLYYDLVRVPHGHVPAGKVFLWGRFPLAVKEFRGDNFFKCPECGSPSFFKIDGYCRCCASELDDAGIYEWDIFSSKMNIRSVRRQRRAYFRCFLKDLEVLVLPVLALFGKAWYVRADRRHWRDGQVGYGRVF